MSSTVSSRLPRSIRTLALASVAASALLSGGILVPAFAPNLAHAAAEDAYERGYADLVDKVMPAVVSVQVDEVLAQKTGEQGPAMDPRMREFMERFFGQQMPEQAQPQQRGPEHVQGLGSGFVIDGKGFICTNAHVVNGAEKITVVLQSGERLPAKLVGVDPKTDLAVIKVDSAKALPVVDFGDSGKVRVGDKVVAVGNPFGLGGTVTAGIVSATGRELGSGPYDDFLQVDAPINRGNSGGPTFDLDGHVIGVNSMIFSPSGGSVGIGFAISSNLAKQVTASLIEDGEVTRGWIGVGVQDMDDDLKASLDLTGKSGALVSQVDPAGPAAEAGIKPGDVILSFDGQSIDKLSKLPRAVASVEPGTTSKVAIWRDGAEKDLSLTVQRMPAPEQTADAQTQAPAVAGQPKLGLALAPLTEDVRRQLDLGKDVKGAVVEQVVSGSPAEEKGIQQGDVIVAVGDTSVDKPSTVISAVKHAAQQGDKAVRLLVMREGDKRWVAVPLATS